MKMRAWSVGLLLSVVVLASCSSISPESPDGGRLSPDGGSIGADHGFAGLLPQSPRHSQCRVGRVTVPNLFGEGAGWRWRDDSSAHRGGSICAQDWNCCGGGDSDCGKRLVAGCSGRIVGPRRVSGFGLQVGIHCQGGPLDGLFLVYSHLGSAAVQVGQSVCAGDTIGTVGKSGGPWGGSHYCHLHVELLRQFPGPNSESNAVPFSVDLAERPRGCTQKPICSYVDQGPKTAQPFPVEQGSCYLFGLTFKYNGSECLETHPLHRNLGAVLSINAQKMVVDSALCSPKWKLLTGGRPNCIRAGHLSLTTGAGATKGRLCAGQYGQFQFEACVRPDQPLGPLKVYFSLGLPNQGNRLLAGCRDQGIHFSLQVRCPSGAWRCEGGAAVVCRHDGSGWDRQPCPHGCQGGRCQPAPAPRPRPACQVGARRCVGDTLESCDASGAWQQQRCSHGCMAAVQKCRTSPAPAADASSCTANQAVCGGPHRAQIWLCTDTGSRWIYQRSCDGLGGCFDGRCVAPKTSCTITFDSQTRRLWISGVHDVDGWGSMRRDRSVAAHHYSATDVVIKPGHDMVFAKSKSASYRFCKLVGLSWREERSSQGQGGYLFLP